MAWLWVGIAVLLAVVAMGGFLAGGGSFQNVGLSDVPVIGELGFTSIEDISKHPENYVGKTVAVKGSCMCLGNVAGATHTLSDEQGYKITIKLMEGGREYAIGLYKMKGVVKYASGETYIEVQDATLLARAY